MIEISIWLDLTVLTYLSKFCFDTLNHRTNDLSLYFCLAVFSRVFYFWFVSFSQVSLILIFDMQRFHEFSAKNDLFTSRVLTNIYSFIFLAWQQLITLYTESSQNYLKLPVSLIQINSLICSFFGLFAYI